MTQPKLDDQGNPLVHPLAALFPMLTDDELAEMAADIKERGLLQPITIDADGRVLDGRNRVAACKIADVEPRYETYAGDDPEGYAFSVNINRRHLNAGARQIIAEQARRLTGKTKNSYSASEAVQLSEAAVVLDWAPDLAPNIVAGAQPLYKAVEEARRRKREAAALADKMAYLLKAAPDLHALVRDEMQAVDEAIAAYKHREEQARLEADRIAQEEAERLEQERLAEQERLNEEERERLEAEAAAQRERRTATELLCKTVPPLADLDGAELAARYDAALVQPGLPPVTPGVIRDAILSLQAALSAWPE